MKSIHETTQAEQREGAEQDADGKEKSVLSNKVFWKAISLLSHPVSLAAIAILFVNDHLLRRLWPSWATGKIGDVAWLFFIPFALAAILSWLVPNWGVRREKVVGWLAFGLTGAVFALSNTLPSFHAWMAHWTETLMGFPVSMQRDPTDLMALASLGLSWWFWEQQPAREPSFGAPGWIVLPLAGLLTIANATAPNYGIDCLVLEEDQIVASTVHETFVSEDGGRSWKPVPWELRDDCRKTNEISDLGPADPDTGDWPIESDFAPANQAQRAYYHKTRSGNIFFRDGPLDVKTDPDTGNTIFAMGHEGIAVRTAGGAWHWVPVGDYRRARLSRTSVVLSLLEGEGVLALCFGLLCASTLSLRVNRSLLRAVLLAIAWLLWAVNVVFLPPALTTGYSTFILYPLLVVMALIVFGLALFSAFRVFQSSLKFLMLFAVVALVGTLLFFLPYVLWAIGSLANYSIAVLFAVALGAATLLVGDRWQRGWLKKMPGWGDTKPLG